MRLEAMHHYTSGHGAVRARPLLDSVLGLLAMAAGAVGVVYLADVASEPVWALLTRPFAGGK